MNLDEKFIEKYDNAFKDDHEAIYRSFMDELAASRIADPEKNYLYEACFCASNNHLLAAITMLACAAEHFLANLCGIYYQYIRKQGTSVEISNFERKVLRAKTSYEKLKAFNTFFNANLRLFKNVGFEEPPENLNFLQVIGITRSEEGLPAYSSITSKDIINYLTKYRQCSRLLEEKIGEK